MGDDGMILVGNQISEKIRSCSLIQNSTPSNVQSMLYDLTAEKFIERVDSVNQEHSHFMLLPHQSIVVATKEIINLPNNMIGHVVGKNSRIREGLLVESPVYQPGHQQTRVYFRITNLSNSGIRLNSGSSYASIIFEELSVTPDHSYTGSFQGEIDYSHLGDYNTQYSREISAVEKKLDEFKNLEKSIYGNVITLLTVFIAIFSIVNVNVELANGNSQNWANLLLFNLCTVGSISLLADFVLYHLSPKTFKTWFWYIPVLCFAGALGTLIFLTLF